MKRILMCALALCASMPAVSAKTCVKDASGSVVCGDGVNPQRAQWKEGAAGSVYNWRRNSFFARGGVVFANSSFDTFVPVIQGFGSAYTGSIGYRRTFARDGDLEWGFETEALFGADSATAVDLLTLTPLGDVRFRTVTGLLGLRAQWLNAAGVSPFASVGVGPSYVWAKAVSPVVLTRDQDWTVAVSGRAGVLVSVSEALSLEVAYRNLRFTNGISQGNHAIDFGLNIAY